MQIKREDLSQHFASLPDEELLAIDRDELSHLALECYVNELNRRQLPLEPGSEAPLPEFDGAAEVEPDWLDTASTACSFQVGGGQRYAEDAERACAILRGAGIPSEVISEQDDGGPDSLSVKVPGALSLKASSVLDRDLFNEELEETWKSHFDHLSDDELRRLNPEEICAGLLGSCRALAARLRGGGCPPQAWGRIARPSSQSAIFVVRRWQMRWLYGTIVCLFTLTGASDLRSQGPRELLLTARRTGTAEVIDAVTLETIARIHFDFQVEHLSASADGSRLEVAGYAAGAPCCKHYGLDPATLSLQEETSPTDRSNFGPCLVSPDGRWCYRLKSFRGPALETVDLREPGSTRVLIPPGLPEENSEGNWAATGVWSGDRFYLYVQRPNDPGWLWTVLPGAEALGTATRVAPFSEAPGCREQLAISKSLVAAAGQIFLYEPFGSKADRTSMCGTGLPGGAWMLDTTTGSLTGQIASDFHFSRLIADQSGSTLYGVALGGPGWNGPVQLVQLDERDGTVLRARAFEPGVLQIEMGNLATTPVGDVAAHH